MFHRSAHFRLLVADGLSRLLPDFVSGVLRGRLYRWAGFDVSASAFLMGRVHLTSAFPGFYTKLRIGPGTVVAGPVTVNLDAPVAIGSNVAIGPHVLIYTGSHRVGPGSMRIGPNMALPVVIEDGAWVRVGAVITPGVTVGRGSIIAAGAVVLKDVAANSYVEGNPARAVRRLPWGNR
ncbi:MAG: acyltransferase [Frankiaceae bacterium]